MVVEFGKTAGEKFKYVIERLGNTADPLEIFKRMVLSD
jgi:hypothetical protein